MAARYRQRGDGAGRAARRRGRSTRSLAQEVAVFLGRQRGVRRRGRSAWRSGPAARAVARPDRRAEGASPCRASSPSRSTAAHPPISRRCAGRSAQFKGVTLDDHRHWQQQIRTMTRSFALGGLAILLLLGRRRHDGHHRLGDEERDGLQPRDRRGAALRRRHGPLHRSREFERQLPAPRHPRRACRRDLRDGGVRVDAHGDGAARRRQRDHRRNAAADRAPARSTPWATCCSASSS